MSANLGTPSPQNRDWPEQDTVHSPVLPKEEARQGVTGHNVRYVLGFSIAAIVLVFFVIYLIYFA